MQHAAVVCAAGDRVRYPSTRAMKVIRRDIFWEQCEEAGGVPQEMGHERPIVERSSSDLGSPPRPNHLPANIRPPAPRPARARLLPQAPPSPKRGGRYPPPPYLERFAQSL